MGKILLLAGVLFITRSAWAVECFQGYGVPCHEWQPNVKDNCGQGCTYTYDAETLTLTVKAENDNATINAGAFMPYSYQTDTTKKTFPSATGDIKVENVIIDGKFKHINNYAFLDLGATIKGSDNTLVAEGISRGTFYGNTVSGNIIIDKIDMNYSNLFNGTTFSEDFKIYCVGKNTEECRNYIINSCNDEPCINRVTPLLVDDSLFGNIARGCLIPEGNLNCTKCEKGYLAKEGDCISSSAGCGAGYRQFENFCNRIQYTPAEAAKVLRNDNTNEVTITFKK